MRLLRRRLRGLKGDRGSTIVEVIVGSTLLLIALTGVVGSMSSGTGLVGHSRQRSSGSGVAQERIERAHNIAYEDIGLNEQPTHVSTPGHPDVDVSEDGTKYKGELLVVDLVDGGLKHLDDPFTLANTDFVVHQYVTWVDDAAVGDTEPAITGTQSYKRVTVVVKWKFPVHSTSNHTVTQSTFITDGTVTGPTPTPPAALPSSIPTTSPLASSAPPSGDDPLGVGTVIGPLLGPLNPSNSQCSGDVTAPLIGEMIVLSGSGTEQGYLNSTSVEIRFSGVWDPECNPLDIYMKNATSTDDLTNGCRATSGYTAVQKATAATDIYNIRWSIPSGDGFKAICAVAENKGKKTSDAVGATVKLDQTKPSVPPSFQQVSCTLTGNNDTPQNSRVVSVSWNSATDANFYGYRLYRSVESSAFALVGQTTSTNISDTAQKNYASVRYLVRAYDKAGNESLDSNILSYSKNHC